MKPLLVWVLIFAAVALVGALDDPEYYSFRQYIQEQKNNEQPLRETGVLLVEKAVENPAVPVYIPSPTFWR